MKKIIDYISIKWGLTKTEVAALFISVSIFGFGFIAKTLKFRLSEIEQEKFDYSYHDSLFTAIVNSKNQTTHIEEKSVDSNLELSNFSNYKNEAKKLLSEKSININFADISSLEKLPGIGKKTAERIINYRQKNGNFKSIEDLKKIKGIKDKRFSKIKKYLYIEK